ncbi:LOW QUALITY PROTEIN: hypothetical protein TorRG33x02_257690 [Trema orientale]|uniref:Uncharacterized protein n=1 Tax=Trema orientale TaxID=63057 RepID=A0A2P5DAA6_TREOI|nr:LOW QUALITY PROTEIN: hypothetical protein TorRG33x02_257690 [Trema orientale]
MNPRKSLRYLFIDWLNRAIHSSIREQTLQLRDLEPEIPISGHRYGLDRLVVEHLADSVLDRDFDLRGVDRDGAAGDGVGIVGECKEAGDDFSGGLDAPEERHEDPVDRETQVVSELPACVERPGQTRFEKGWVPGPRRRGDPEGLEVVEAVAVPHDDDVLAVGRWALVGDWAVGGLGFRRVHWRKRGRELDDLDPSRRVFLVVGE